MNDFSFSFKNVSSSLINLSKLIKFETRIKSSNASIGDNRNLALCSLKYSVVQLNVRTLKVFLFAHLCLLRNCFQFVKKSSKTFRKRQITRFMHHVVKCLSLQFPDLFLTFITKRNSDF